MPDEIPVAVDAWLEERLGAVDPALTAAREANAAAGLPPIDVSPNQGQFLRLLAEIHGARRILEIGTLGGMSTILLGRALPEDGALVSIELDVHHAETARANLERAGLADRCRVLTGDASDVLAAMVAGDEEPFDLVFVDADKASTAEYVAWALDLTRPGSVLLVDNVVRGGRVLESDPDASTGGVQRFVEMVASEPRLDAAALQTVGRKGHDGFVLARVVESAPREVVRARS